MGAPAPRRRPQALAGGAPALPVRPRSFGGARLVADERAEGFGQAGARGLEQRERRAGFDAGLQELARARTVLEPRAPAFVAVLFAVEHDLEAARRERAGQVVIAVGFEQGDAGR